ncbi:MAG: hypothetical protein V1663_02925 [archaeon]
MCLSKMLEKCKKKMKWYDFSLLKLSVFFTTLFLITAWPGFLNFILGFEWYIYLIITVILMIPLLSKMFSK